MDSNKAITNDVEIINENSTENSVNTSIYQFKDIKFKSKKHWGVDYKKNRKKKNKNAKKSRRITRKNRK